MRVTLYRVVSDKYKPGQPWSIWMRDRAAAENMFSSRSPDCRCRIQQANIQVDRQAFIDECMADLPDESMAWFRRAIEDEDNPRADPLSDWIPRLVRTEKSSMLTHDEIIEWVRKRVSST